MRRVNKANLLLLFSFVLLVITPVRAIEESTIRDILRTIIGDLPNPCQVSLSDPQCIYCVGYVKVLPFMFFFGLVYFMIANIIEDVVFRRRGGKIMEHLPSLFYPILMISIPITLFVLHLSPFGAISRMESFYKWFQGVLDFIFWTLMIILLYKFKDAILNLISYLTEPIPIVGSLVKFLKRLLGEWLSFTIGLIIFLYITRRFYSFILEKSAEKILTTSEEVRGIEICIGR